MKNQATPYLTFEGNAREALDYYTEVFEADVLEIQTFGEADFPSPPWLGLFFSISLPGPTNKH